MVSCLDKALGGSLPALSVHSFTSNGQLALFESAEEGKSVFHLIRGSIVGPLLAKQTIYRPSYRTRYLQTDEKDPEFLTCLLYPDKALLCNGFGASLCLNHICMSCLSFEALGQHFHSKLKIKSAAFYVSAGRGLSSNFIYECWNSFFHTAEHILTISGTGNTGATDGSSMLLTISATTIARRNV